ncbi:hypothetical protein [Chitinophaga sp. YR627]|nr:hypothetical protein [Chitinophaga sp. YR627]
MSFANKSRSLRLEKAALSDGRELRITPLLHRNFSVTASFMNVQMAV